MSGVALYTVTLNGSLFMPRVPALDAYHLESFPEPVSVGGM